jgi:hypothetical protein
MKADLMPSTFPLKRLDLLALRASTASPSPALLAIPSNSVVDFGGSIGLNPNPMRRDG